MKYLSVCSGIEAATVAWHPLGWQPVGFSEIEKFPSRVLAHHYPNVRNHGDITNHKRWDVEPFRMLVGGTPCQSFSVAGLRKGMADPRGNLALTYLGIVDDHRPDWFVWENVPGVLSSNGGRDFGSFLGGVAELGYGFAYRVLDAQYVRVDGYGRAVPQRRRRVFVVGNSRSWRRAAAVLFERESLSGNSAPRREAGKGVAARVDVGAGSGGRHVSDIAPTLNAAFGSKLGLENQHIDSGAGMFVAHALRGEGFDASEDGTGRGTPIVPIHAFYPTNRQPEFGIYDNVSPSVKVGSGGQSGNPPAIAHAIQAGALRENPDSGPDGVGGQSGIAYTIEARSEVQAVAFDLVQMTSKANRSTLQSVSPTMAKESQLHAVQGWAVRRLTPTECERLQGFPDGYTNIGKSADGPRYKALGNSMAVNCMAWIGRRIQLVENITRELDIGKIS